MADTVTLQPTSQTREIKRPQEIGGSIEWNSEEAIDTAQKIITESAQGLKDVGDLFFSKFLGLKEALPGTYAESASLIKERLPIGGQTEIRFNNPEAFKKRQEAEHQRIVYASLEEARKNAQRFTHEEILEAVVRLEVAGMSTEEKNRFLHLSLDLDEKHINDPYHIHALRVKRKEQLRTAQQQKQGQELAATVQSPVANLQEVMEGGLIGGARAHISPIATVS